MRKMCKLKYVVLLLFIIGGILAVCSALQKSVTVDEFQALPHGIAIWRTGRLDIDMGVPPLTKLLEAIPALFLNPILNTTNLKPRTDSWKVGKRFMQANPESYHTFFMAGRFVSIAVFLLVCFFSYRLATRLYGPLAGLAALTFTCFSPNLLAHGRLLTTDIYLAFAIVAALYYFDKLLTNPTWKATILPGIMIGLACTFKFSGLILFPFLVCIMAILRIITHDKESAVKWKHPWLMLGAIFAIAFLVINIVYLFGGVGTSLNDYRFGTPLFRGLRRMLPGWVRMPLPRYFVEGVDIQMAEKGYIAYLQGRINRVGFWNYYLVALLVKTPAPTIAMCVLALLIRWRVTPREVPMCFIGIASLFLFSLTSHKNTGVHYMLFCFPLMAIWLSRIISIKNATPSQHSYKKVLSLAAGWLVIATIAVWPNYIPFFNVPSGGPANGHRYLLDANLDIGQDLIGLRRYMTERKIDSIELAYAGRVKPEIYGIKYKLVSTGPRQRYVVISANLLWGRMYFINGSELWPRNYNAFIFWRSWKPVAIIGHTLYVFDRTISQPKHDVVERKWKTRGRSQKW